MARPSELEKMSYAQLVKMEARIERLKIEKQNTERVALRRKLTDIAKEHGYEIRELLDGRRKIKRSVAAKYRDPKNPESTWTGRGRMPRWMAAATKSGKSTKDDFLI
jgi:DNA-binding protein H-NS